MKKVNIIQLGIGNIGGTLIKQIVKNHDVIKRKHNIDLQYCGIFRSTRGIFKSNGIDLKQIKLHNFKKEIKPDEAIKKILLPYILIDTTASDETYFLISQTLKRGGVVILSNKKPLTRSQREFDNFKQLAKGKLFYETTVGAGLPIIQTIKTLQETGDEILEMQGCFSGTLGFICNELERGKKFSETVLLAKNKGYTEPDPCDDLSGMDVARKALILSRLIGKKMELKDISIEKLYPSTLKNLSANDFLKKIKIYDKRFRRIFKNELQRGNTIRYVAHITKKKTTVGLQKVKKSSIIGSLEGPANCIVIKTKRYSHSPLIIAGPGAGPEVTASGVFGDILSTVISF